MNAFTYDELDKMMAKLPPKPKEIIRVTKHAPATGIYKVGEDYIMSPNTWNFFQFNYMSSDERVAVILHGSLWGMKVEFDEDVLK